MSRTNIWPFLKILAWNNSVFIKMKFIPVAFTLLFLWVIMLQPYLLRFSEESIKTGFMSRTNVFLFMPLI